MMQRQKFCHSTVSFTVSLSYGFTVNRLSHQNAPFTKCVDHIRLRPLPVKNIYPIRNLLLFNCLTTDFYPLTSTKLAITASIVFRSTPRKSAIISFEYPFFTFARICSSSNSWRPSSRPSSRSNSLCFSSSYS